MLAAFFFKYENKKVPKTSTKPELRHKNNNNNTLENHPNKPIVNLGKEKANHDNICRNVHVFQRQTNIQVY